MPSFIFILLCIHIEYQFLDETKTDNSGPFMILCIKLGLYVWSIHDGNVPVADLPQEFLDVSLKDVPPLVDFLGYCFFFAGWMIGPAFEYADYSRFIQQKAPFNNIRGRSFATLKNLVVGILCFSLFLTYGKKLAHDIAAKPEFIENPFWYRVSFLMFAGIFQRNKFYGGWKISEAACTLAGINYSGVKVVNGSEIFVWNRVENVNIWAMETAQSPRDYINAWNKNTARWLRKCVYIRLSQKSVNISAFWAPFVTYLISAIWHGIRPNYYFTFISGAFVTMIGQILRRTLRPLFLIPSKWAVHKWIYDVFGWIFTQAIMNYICAPFVLFSIVDATRIWINNIWEDGNGLENLTSVTGLRRHKGGKGTTHMTDFHCSRFPLDSQEKLEQQFQLNSLFHQNDLASGSTNSFDAATGFHSQSNQNLQPYSQEFSQNMNTSNLQFQSNTDFVRPLEFGSQTQSNFETNSLSQSYFEPLSWLSSTSGNFLQQTSEWQGNITSSRSIFDLNDYLTSDPQHSQQTNNILDPSLAQISIPEPEIFFQTGLNFYSQSQQPYSDQFSSSQTQNLSPFLNQNQTNQVYTGHNQNSTTTDRQTQIDSRSSFTSPFQFVRFQEPSYFNFQRDGTREDIYSTQFPWVSNHESSGTHSEQIPPQHTLPQPSHEFNAYQNNQWVDNSLISPYQQYLSDQTDFSDSQYSRHFLGHDQGTAQSISSSNSHLTFAPSGSGLIHQLIPGLNPTQDISTSRPANRGSRSNNQPPISSSFQQTSSNIGSVETTSTNRVSRVSNWIQSLSTGQSSPIQGNVATTSANRINRSSSQLQSFSALQQNSPIHRTTSSNRVNRGSSGSNQLLSFPSFPTFPQATTIPTTSTIGISDQSQAPAAVSSTRFNFGTVRTPHVPGSRTTTLQPSQNANTRVPRRMQPPSPRLIEQIQARLLNSAILESERLESEKMKKILLKKAILKIDKQSLLIELVRNKNKDDERSDKITEMSCSICLEEFFDDVEVAIIESEINPQDESSEDDEDDMEDLNAKRLANLEKKKNELNPGNLIADVKPVQNNQEVVGKLVCGHIFHVRCVEDWILRNPTCPNCRTD
ncbi:lysophospholipid acyltransferase, partial [Nowakowskiella sp. JEL0078]